MMPTLRSSGRTQKEIRQQEKLEKWRSALREDQRKADQMKVPDVIGWAIVIACVVLFVLSVS
jgi:hypothetical protein